MLSIGLIGHGQGAADYYVTRQAGCALDYYTGVGERRGHWTGTGATTLGLSGELNPAGEQALRGLLAGVGPDGVALVGAVRRSDPRARVPAVPLVAAVRAVARANGLPPPLFLDGAAGVEFARVARALTRSPRATVGVRADVAVRIAQAAGLDPHAIYAASTPPSLNVASDGGLLAVALGHVGQQVDTRRAGLDLTFSAPKSVSLLFAFGDPDVVAAVRAAHETAISEALTYLEHVAGHGLRGHHGDGQRATHVETDGFVGVAFEHRTSRAMDPQLHTHVVVPNLVHGHDGQWSALDTRGLHRHARTAGYLYQAVLRGQLNQTLGVQWAEVRRGQAEIVGVPTDAMRLFSTRRGQIREQLDTTGASGGRAAQVACLATRPPKTSPGQSNGVEGAGSPGGLREQWAARARAAGIDPDKLVQRALTQADGSGNQGDQDRPEHCRPLHSVLARTLLGPDGLTEHATSFDRADLLRGICQHLPPGTPTTRTHIEALADQVLANPGAVPLVTDPEGSSEHEGEPRRWTTSGLLAVEARALALAEHLRATPSPAADPQWVQDCIDDSTLTSEQAAMVHALTTTPGSLSVVIGPAGSGKTAALAVAYRAWRVEGRSVHGCALSALAAKGLSTSSGIPCVSVAAMLAELEGDRAHVRPGTVLIVDEAAMVGTRNLARLLQQATTRRMQIVLVGDPAQLPEIGAGGLFTRLATDTTVTTLTANQRQTATWEQGALTRLRDGDIPGALDSYLAHQRVHISPDHQHLQDQIADDYLTWRDRLDHQDRPGPTRSGGGVLVVAATRHHAAQINDRIRERLADRGDLHGAELHCTAHNGDTGSSGGGDGDGLALRAGDRVQITVNDHHRGLLNGEQAHITAVDVHRGELVLRADDNRELTVPATWAATHLGYGYALTCHKAQGQTVDITLIAGSAALTRETTYTALSRGRSANHLYLAPDTALDPLDDSAQAWIEDHALADASQHMRTTRRQTLAADLTTRPHPSQQQRAQPPAIGF